MRSFSITRTNVGLTTNAKIIVSSDYDLYLESIDSSPELSDSKYKKFRFNKDNYYDELVPYFFKNLPVDIAFAVKYDDDNDNMFSEFDKQYDDIYQMGCRNITDNKSYTEEYECFAPLYISPYSIPKNFIVFRVDGAGLTILNKDNFRTEILNKLKCVKNFSLTKETPLGEWIDKNFRNNPLFPSSPFYVDFRDSEFSYWSGIDMTGGGYTHRSYFLDTTFQYENTYFDLERTVYDGYRNNKIAFPNILNLSFLFDDTPATPSSLRKWSINRYMGFYFDDLEFVCGVSAYIPPRLKSDVQIYSGNILRSPSSSTPFDETWKKVEIEYVEIGGVFYPIQSFQEVTGSSLNKVLVSNKTYQDQVSDNYQTYYKIISDKDLSGLTYSVMNQNIISITTNNKLIKYSDNSSYIISDFDSADLWLIEIDSKLHVLVKVNGDIYIQTDYGFDISADKLDYYINYPDPNYRTSVSLVVDANNSPKIFNIYKCNFTDIKDFDTSVIDTDYSKYEYEKRLDLTQTDETKLYAIDYNSTSIPKDIEDYKINDQVVNIPASSEYTANGETFRIVDRDLSPIWRKNPIRAKWGFQGSISANDYPYLLNNSFLSEDYNRTTNTFDPNPHRVERNLDYFYTVNSATSSYLHHSLHVQDFDTNDFKFELDKYLNLATYSVGTSSAIYNQDYFTQFFGKRSKFDSGDIIKRTKKWSEFNTGDSVTPNISLFRGIKFKISDVDSVKVSNGNIDNINVKNNNNYEGYKLSILLSKNEYDLNVDSSGNLIGLTSASNGLTWSIIDTFKYDKPYKAGDIVEYHDILYKVITDTTISDPNIGPIAYPPAPFGQTSWGYFTSSTIFWTPVKSYVPGNVIYNDGEYYESIGNSAFGTGKNFWIPGKVYGITDRVIYKSKFWKSMKYPNTKEPTSKEYYVSGTSSYNPYWVELTDESSDIWSIVELWSDVDTYALNSYVVHNKVLYKCLSPTGLSGIEPGFDDTKWQRVYSMVPDTDYVYSSNSNNTILLNNRFYFCVDNTNLKTLDDGIIVYINKKWKNILVNIYMNDNTLNNLSNADRDLLYNDMYSKITAYNFMNCLNNLSNKYGFVDYVKYVVIDNDSTKVYSFSNIQNLPIILQVESPDQLFSRIKSLDKKPVNLKTSQFKSKRRLNKANILTIDMLNWYNDSLSLGTEIDRILEDQGVIPYYHGLSNNIYNNLFRHSGAYCPIFYNVELFEVGVNGSGQVGNYKFDTTLTNFGKIKEQVISKINRKYNILQLKDKPDIKSIYPMIDEFGYTTIDFFVFKSTWDYEYHVECNEVKQLPPATSNKSLKVNFVDKNSLL